MFSCRDSRKTLNQRSESRLLQNLWGTIVSASFHKYDLVGIASKPMAGLPEIKFKSVIFCSTLVRRRRSAMDLQKKHDPGS